VISRFFGFFFAAERGFVVLLALDPAMANRYPNRLSGIAYNPHG